jgi:tetratricopeptide (TPR) repeat protein
VKQARVSNPLHWLLAWGAMTMAAALTVPQFIAPAAIAQVRDATPPPPTSTPRTSTPTLGDHDHSRAERQFATGLQLAADNQSDAAIAVFSGLTRDYPRLREPYQQLAALHAKRGDLRRAVIALQTAVRLGVQDSQLQEQLGDLYVQLAISAYRQALDTEQPSVRLRNKYAILQSVNPPPVPAGARPP